MSAVLSAKYSRPAPPAIYDEEMRERLQCYYGRSQKADYWASCSFEPFWRKFQGGVAQELELARRVAHWVDLSRARVLVIGSYLGTEAVAYALRGAEVVGIDLDEDAMDVSRELARRHDVDIEICARDACDTGFADHSFDYISCAQVLEHLPPGGQLRLLEEMCRLCQPGGYLWVDTPNQMAWRDRHDTGLPFIHWLPRSVKIPLARMLGRAITIPEPAFDQPVYLHYYLSYGKLNRILAGLGAYQVVSKYRGHADIDHYRAVRERQHRNHGFSFALKTAVLRQVLKVWDWNRFASTRVMIHKLPQSTTQTALRLRRQAGPRSGSAKANAVSRALA